MIPEITQQNLHLLLPGKITTLAQFYAEDHGCTMFEAIRHLYASPLYERLADGRDRGQVSVLPIFLRLRARRGFPQDTVLSPVPLKWGYSKMSRSVMLSISEVFFYE